MTSITCPSLEELCLLLEEELDEVRRVEIGDHIEVCDPCQDRLERLTTGKHGNRCADDQTTDGASELKGARTESSPRLDLDKTHEHEAVAPVSRTSSTPAYETDPGAITSNLPDDPDKSTQSISEPPRRQTCSAMNPPSAWPGIPGYELLEKLGEGGMGVVYLARQVGLNRFVAVKMIRGGSQARPEQFGRFRVEAEAVAQLRHPHIIQIHDIGAIDDQPYVSLELLEGGSLADRLNGTPQPGKQSAELTETLARAVHAAHDAGIVHRDLKPSNVLFSEDGVPKVTDFGLAKRLESDSRQTETGQIIGSPSYMAPEQARGHAKNVGPAADIYALGAILYEQLTGRTPFKGETPMETVRQVVDDEVVPPSRLVPKVSRDLETICLKCLNKEPSRRYATARELADDLARYRNGEAIHARRTSVVERGFKWARRRPAAAALLGLGIAIFLGLTAGGATLGLTVVAESRRILRVMSAGDQLIDSARDAQSQERLSHVQAELREFHGSLGSERNPDLVALRERIDVSLREVEQKLLGVQARERKERIQLTERQRFRDFRGLRAQAQLSAAEYESDPTHRQAIFRDSVRKALAVYAQDPTAADIDWSLAAPLPDTLTDVEKTEIVDGCYDLLLVLSRSADASAGLKILDRAARLRPEPTAAYHIRRAECLDKAGDAAGQKREEELAGRRPAVSALDHFLIGRERLTRRQWPQAIESLEAALTLDPNLTAAQILMAVCHYSVEPKRLDEALASLNSCLRSHPDLNGLYLLRALLHGERGNRIGAAFANEHRSDTSALRRKAAREFEAAEADYRAVLERRPNDDLRYVLLVNRGGMYLQAGRLAESLADLERAIRLQPELYQAHASVAQLYQRQRLWEDAAREFARAIERTDDRTRRVELHRSRARLHSSRPDATPDQRAAALRDLDAAIRLESENPAQKAKDHVERARLCFGGTQFSEALEACTEALKLVPDEPSAQQLKISTLMAMKRFDQVMDSCDAYLAREKPTVEILEIRGLARVARRNRSGAISDYTQALELRADLDAATRTRLLNHRGWAYQFADAPRLAFEDFEASLKLDKDQSDALGGRGLARIRLGEWRLAIADAESAVRLVNAMPIGDAGAETRLRAHLNAARIYAQAVEFSAELVSRQGERAVALYRSYRARALGLLRQALSEVPAADRAGLLADPALQPLRLNRGASYTTKLIN
jgi:tetratricopeptide (TPR) repeat protein